MKCIIYTRTATEKQAKDFNSLEAQEKILRDYAKRNNLEVGQVISDMGSGNNTSRQGMKNLLNIISSGEYKAILCSDIERISRNFLAFLNFYKFIVDKKMEIITPNGTYKADPIESLTNIFSLGQAQFDRHMLSERIKRGMRQAKARKQ